MVKNPNCIGKLMTISNDLPTSSDKVYRSVFGEEAIKDLLESGIVRNKQSAGLTKSRWGNRVFWSQGEEGQYHVVQNGGFVIEAHAEVAQKRIIKISDVTAIFMKNSKGEIVDVLNSLFD